MTSIDSFIPWYDDIKSDNFQYNTTRKEEFYDLMLSDVEPNPTERGEYFSHQIFIQRFLSDKTLNDRQILVWEVGTGKSCALFALSEHYKSVLLDNLPRKKALILSQGELLLNNLKNELVRVCSKPGTYNPKGVISEKSEKIRTTKSINENYDFYTYETFLTQHVNGRKKSTGIKEIPPKSDSYIKENFSNRLIVIDEGHNLREQKGKKESVGLYRGFHRFLHVAENCKVLILTGTPQWDNVEETASLFNLILPDDEQLPTGAKFTERYITKEGDIKNADELRKIFSGRISFLRQQSSVATKLYQGQRKPWLDHTTIYPDIMSKFQADIVEAAKKKKKKTDKRYSDEGEEESYEVSVGLHQYEREASNVVFPDGSFGDEALKKHLLLKKGEKAKFSIKSKDNKVYGFRDRDVATEMAKNISKYSSKMSAIIEDILAHQDELIFVNMSFVKNSGIIVMALLLMEVSFLRNQRYIQVKKNVELLKGTKGFGIITSETTSPSEARDIINAFNSSENIMNANRCQVIFGSRMVSQGISLKGVRRLHIGNPHWNPSLTKQTEGRVFRIGSHSMLPKDKQNVEIFLHAAVEGKGSKPLKKETVDLMLYKLSEEKGYRIAKMTRIEKESASDCALFYKRNVLKSDVESNQISIDKGLGPINECDYNENCNYKCATMEPTSTSEDIYSYKLKSNEILRDTYNLYYSQKDILSIIDKMSNIFSSRFSISIQDLHSILNVNMGLLLMAIDVAIEERVLFRDRYGFPVYVKDENDILFLVRNLAEKSLYENSYYVSNPYFTEKTNLESLVEIAKMYNDKRKIEKFCKMPLKNASDKNKLSKLIDSMDYRVKIILVEACYKEYNINPNLSKQNKEKCKYVLDLYKSSIYELENGNVAHVLYYAEFSGTSYNITSKILKAEGMTRCFNPKQKMMTSVSITQSKMEPEWVFCEPEEEEKVLAEIKGVKAKTKKIGFENNPYGIYGTISMIDKKFRVVEQPLPGKSERSGSVCKQLPSKPRIIDYLLKTDFQPIIKENIDSLNRARLLAIIKNVKISKETSEKIDKMTDKELKRLISIITIEKNDLCDSLQKFFESKGLLYYI